MEEAMNWSGLFRSACVAAALSCFGQPQAEALEIFGGAHSIARVDEGLISKVVVVRRGGAYHGGVYRGPRGGVYRGGTVYRGGVYRGGAYRGYGYHPGYRPGYYGAWARPGWYGWPAGGAIAAGAAIGVVGAAAAASWAGAPPAPGLCWYYTDPSRQQGFWDACQ
jgi:hypothetical protein